MLSDCETRATADVHISDWVRYSAYKLLLLSFFKVATAQLPILISTFRKNVFFLDFQCKIKSTTREVPSFFILTFGVRAIFSVNLIEFILLSADI